MAIGRPLTLHFSFIKQTPTNIIMFPITIIPCLFAMVMDRMTDEIREEAPWTIMFADDIVNCSESKKHVEKTESWRYSLERRGMKVNRRKAEYMCVNERQDNGTVKIQEVAKVEDFKCLSSTVQSNGACGREVKKRVHAWWNGWRRMSGVICDRRVPARVKGKLHKVAVRPAMLYGWRRWHWRKDRKRRWRWQSWRCYDFY